MKMLFISAHFPHPNAVWAGCRSIFQLIESLSKKHEIYLISAITRSELHRVDDVKKYCQILGLVQRNTTKSEKIKSALHSLFTHPTYIGKRSHIEIGNITSAVFKKYSFDIIQVEFTDLAEHIPIAPNTPMVLDAHDVRIKPYKRKYELSRSLPEKIYRYWQLRKIEKSEIDTCKKFNLILTVCELDKKILLSYNPNLNIFVYPHMGGITINSNKQNNPEPKSLLFVGAMDRKENEDAVIYFVKSILPLIMQKIPDVRFYIVGNAPSLKVKSLASDNIVVTGYVERIEDYYNKASVFVAPIRIGGGIIIKLLGALAAGIPSVATSVANEGISAVDNRDILLADTPEDFANKVISLLEDEKLRNVIGNNGYIYVQKTFNFNEIVSKLEIEYQKLIDKSKSKNGIS